MADQTLQSILPWNNEDLKKVLLELIAHGAEAAKVDFKAELELVSLEQKAELLKDVTAMANSYDDSNGDYGFIIYGVRAGKITGISTTEIDTDKLQNTIDQLLKEYIAPMPLVYVLSFEETTKEKWGVLVIAPRHNKPYMFFKDISCQNQTKSRRKGEWFVRKGSTTSPGLPEDLTRITQKQTELLIVPLQESVRNLQDRVNKVEGQYETALFKVVTKAVSIIEGENAVAIEKEVKVELESPEVEPSARLKFPLAHAKDGPARFRGPDEALGFEDDTFGENGREVFLSKGSAMWLRVMPVVNPQREWPTRELRRIALDKSHLLPLQHPPGGYSYLRASDGEGMYRAKGDKTDPKTVDIDSVAFAFKTGEVWSIETAMFSWDTDKLYSTEIEKAFVIGIGNYGLFLKELGMEPPFHWKAGLVGVRGRHLSYLPPPGHQWLREKGPTCATDRIEAEGQIIEDGQNPATALLPFFEKIFEECGKERPDYLPH
ncbi:ATP-binding protein [Candidatus Parcubacteria bacterium]|nr:ATP-binding protein [Candidatus Parcubacteria bacterium]